MNQGTHSGAQPMSLINNGTTNATNVMLSLASGSEFSISSNNCGTAAHTASIAGGSSCTFQLTFSPTATGARSDTLQADYDTTISSGQTASATVNGSGTSVSTGPVYGMTIPTTHPALWFDSARLAQAKTWYASHAFTPSNNMWDDAHNGYASTALRGLLNNEKAQCDTAVAWALEEPGDKDEGIPDSGTSCDQCRWFGEQIILTYDWCFNFLSADQKSQLLTATNKWVEEWRNISEDDPNGGWGGVGTHMHQNNYYWGYLRNELEWALTSYWDNTTEANKLLDDVITRRLADDFNNAPDSVGGVGQEGSEYGPYLGYYAVVPFETADMLGLDLYAESNFWIEAVYADIYNTLPAATYSAIAKEMQPALFPWGDDESWYNESGSPNVPSVSDMMAQAAIKWSGSNTAGYARQWMSSVGSAADYYIKAVDPGGPSKDLSNLPFDYYAAGPRYLWGHNNWSGTGTAFMLQLGDLKSWAGENQIQGHSHADYGTWQIWRNGRWLSHETEGYSESVVDYNNSGSADIASCIPHNSVLIDGGCMGGLYTPGIGVVRRLESQPGYTYADVDLTNVAADAKANMGIGSAANFVHVEREFVFVRDLETMIILDRLQSASASSTKTFISHCETNPTIGTASATCTNGSQALVMTTLLPASPTYRKLNEGSGAQGAQYRIEVDTKPGTAQSYILTVLQAKDASAASLSPQVSDGGTSYTVTLDSSHSIVFTKGMSSSGGSITISGSATAFRSGVEPMTVTPDGPTWGP